MKAQLDEMQVAMVASKECSRAKGGRIDGKRGKGVVVMMILFLSNHSQNNRGSCSYHYFK